MADILIYSDTQDGYVSSTSTSDFAAARDRTSGASNPLITRYAYAARASQTTSRGTTTWTFVRSFFEFDTSSIHTAPQVALLSIYGYNQNSADFYVVKSTQGTSLANADFDAIEGWVGGEDNSSNVTKYSSEVTTWSTSGYNAILLNGQAKADIAALDNFTICCIENDYDLVNNDPGADFTAYTGMFYSDYVGTAYDPKLRITPGFDTLFFGANF
jgi:hypothetical protein